MSAILSADDLNDFISPGVACIKPIETLPSSAPPAGEDFYQLKFSNEAPLPSDLPPAQISLTDCLACSGCVTSAEAVLVSLQSHSEVLHALDSTPAIKLNQNGGIKDAPQESRIFVASVSPQSRASIAATFGVSERTAGYMIEQLLSGPQGLASGGTYKNGFQWVVDTNVAREACLVLGADEVMKTLEGGGTEPQKPVLTSSCPGWICYAEKTHPHVLPHLSRLKSPQALMGIMLKTSLSKKLGISPDRIWHVAVMPCFDKKLEASREELTDVRWDGSEATGQKGVRDVDCVITSKELLMLAESCGMNFADLPGTPLPEAPVFPDSTLDGFLFPPSASVRSNGRPEAGTSGGNLHYILQFYASRHPGSTIQTIRGRNADVVDYSVVSATGEVLFKSARYYGFRNIQNLVRKLKPARVSKMPGARSIPRKAAAKAGSADLAYVEVMACPGGCTNGGGQIKVDDPIVAQKLGRTVDSGPKEQKEWLSAVDEAYFSGSENDMLMSDGENERMAPPPSANGSGQIPVDATKHTICGISPSHIKYTLEHWAGLTELPLDKLAYTTYRAVVSDVGKSKDSETERVAALAGKIGGGW